MKPLKKSIFNKKHEHELSLIVFEEASNYMYSVINYDFVCLFGKPYPLLEKCLTLEVIPGRDTCFKNKTEFAVLNGELPVYIHDNYFNTYTVYDGKTKALYLIRFADTEGDLWQENRLHVFVFSSVNSQKEIKHALKNFFEGELTKRAHNMEQAVKEYLK